MCKYCIIALTSSALKIVGRTYKPIIGGDYALTVRFEGNDGEKIFGMGQYQQHYLNQKGCVLELAQRNSQVSIPFAVSSLGYGFLWNNPAVGKASFGKNMTEWHADAAKEIDYWITVGETPAELIENYTAVTGRAPHMPEDLLGLWQCKLRYHTQEEVLTVARKYKELGIPLDVIVIDFFHWTRQGDWHFDPEYWPDPKAMCDELHAMLRFISAVKTAFATVQTFQYIPCYGLSSAPCCHRIGATSFQYIPCYGLSNKVRVHVKDKVQFQYIPCYGLSSEPDNSL